MSDDRPDLEIHYAALRAAEAADLRRQAAELERRAKELEA